MEGLYREKNEYTDKDLLVFIKENEDQLKREYIDFKYVVLNPKNLITLSSELSAFKSPYIFQLATKYRYLFVIIEFLIYRIVF